MTAAETFLFSCSAVRARASEQVVPEHVLSCIVAGQLRLQLPTETLLLPPGSIYFVRRHQVARAVKLPPPGGEFRAISLLLPQPLLRQYAAAHPAPPAPVLAAPGSALHDFLADTFWQGYFASLRPYFTQPQHFTEAVAHLKAQEALGLLLRQPLLRALLFDFAEPGKLELAAFMLRHYTFHLPLREFARLSGRSLATFKRDFHKAFAQPPEQWLRHQRLEQAHYLIATRQQPPAAAYLEVGFENLSHFSAAFKQQFGYTASSLALGAR